METLESYILHTLPGIVYLLQAKYCLGSSANQLKCDQLSPKCGQCTRATKKSPGYRNMLDLAFRNESESVVEKAKAKSKKARAKRELSEALNSASPPGQKEGSPRSSASFEPLCFYPPTFDCPIWPDDYQYVSISTLSTYSIFPTVEECEVNSFLSNFVCMPSGPSHGNFPYVTELYGREGTNEMLTASLAAAGLAAQANVCKSSLLMAQARKE